MAYRMNFTDQYGDNYPQSYWKPVEMFINVLNHSILIRFGAFINQEKSGGRVIGEKKYLVTSQKFAELINSSITDSSSIKSAVLSKAYETALSTKDVQSGVDEEGNAVMVSFFENAEAV